MSETLTPATTDDLARQLAAALNALTTWLPLPRSVLALIDQAIAAGLLGPAELDLAVAWVDAEGEIGDWQTLWARLSAAQAEARSARLEAIADRQRANLASIQAIEARRQADLARAELAAARAQMAEAVASAGAAREAGALAIMALEQIVHAPPRRGQAERHRAVAEQALEAIRRLPLAQGRPS